MAKSRSQPFEATIGREAKSRANYHARRLLPGVSFPKITSAPIRAVRQSSAHYLGMLAIRQLLGTSDTHVFKVTVRGSSRGRPPPADGFDEIGREVGA